MPFNAATTSSRGPSTRLKIVSKEGEVVRRAIARTIVDRGWSLAEISPVTLTLEDLFVRLVREDPRTARRMGRDAAVDEQRPSA